MFPGVQLYFKGEKIIGGQIYFEVFLLKDSADTFFFFFF